MDWHNICNPFTKPLRILVLAFRSFLLAMGVAVCLMMPVMADTIPMMPSLVAHPDPELIQILSKANVIYLAEHHDYLSDHEAQLDILTRLNAENISITVAMEMFQRPFQSMLDEYLVDHISAEQLREQSEYDQRWGFDWSFYEPLLAFAKANQFPVLALNTPTEITRKVALDGIESLSTDDKRWIPALEDVNLENQKYRDRIRLVYEKHHQSTDSRDGFEQFFQAQVLWDETMAERIVQQVEATPERVVVVIVGEGHVLYDDGIPSRVARRFKEHLTPFKQYSIRFNPVNLKLVKDNAGATDFTWVTSKMSL